MDSTLAQLLQALAGNAAPNVMGNPGGIAGSRLAYMQGQNANQNALLNQQVFMGQQGMNAAGGAQQAREAMAATGGALDQSNNAPPVTPMVAQQPSPQAAPSLTQPAPNPPSAMQQVPMPGAQPMSQSQANQGRGGAIPMPQGSTASAADMSPGTPPSIGATTDALKQQDGQDQQLSPQQAQDLQQTLQQNLQGPHAPQYKDVINAVKQSMPNATPLQRAMATADIMKDVNAQTNELLKRYQALILSNRLQDAPKKLEATLKNADTKAGQLAVSQAKAGLSDGSTTQKILTMLGRKTENQKIGGQVGGTEAAEKAFEKIMPDALAASAKVSRDGWKAANSVGNWLLEQTNSPELAQFAVFNNGLVREYSRALGGGNANVTNAAREHAEEILGATKSQQAYNAAVQAIQKELVDARTGGREAMQAAASRASDADPDVDSQSGIQMPAEGGASGWKFEKVE